MGPEGHPYPDGPWSDSQAGGLLVEPGSTVGPLVTLCVSEGPGSRPGKPHAIPAGEQVLLSTRTVTALSGKLQMGGA